MHDIKIDESGTPRKLNWRPDTPDFRDYKYSAQMLTGDLPANVDLCTTGFISPVVDQGQIGSCTGNGWAGSLELLQLKELFDEAQKNPTVDADKPEIFSDKFNAVARLYIYYNERILEGTVSQDAGAMIRTGFKAVQRWGICPETSWAYTGSNLFRTPSHSAYNLASQHKILSAFKLNNSKLDELKHCLASGFPIVFGMSVFDSFMSRAVAQTGIVPMPKSNESLDGGHCMLIVGYDDSTKLFKIKNSWGKSWGLSGYCQIPYSYLTNQSLASDFWTSRRSQDLVSISNFINHETV